ncbi:hypothetical protein FPQ18DRAFT_42327 [Pyronema domesticum]|uniref:Uncharacterized protein n=1 Tax=Pyronema omphalodes (strain CBS 100304) TaxID=1076935 RepID=U4LG73_PYROM|nr:hypothetical protein FPQ18DRAFT_42327 [Pyronema domesticum]CCX31114.1 Protein of unknown function [Pyronema omphalodes CBS 100304]
MVTADVAPSGLNPSQSRNDAIQIFLNSASLIIAIIMLLLKVIKRSGKHRRPGPGRCDIFPNIILHRYQLCYPIQLLITTGPENVVPIVESIRHNRTLFYKIIYGLKICFDTFFRLARGVLEFTIVQPTLRLLRFMYIDEVRTFEPFACDSV